MKNSIFIFFAFLAGSYLTSAQQTNNYKQQLNPSQQKYDWKNMSGDERKKTINSMSSEERSELLNDFRENMMVSELEVPNEKQEQFRDLYTEYQERQKNIKSKFQPTKDYNSLTDEEAKAKLNQSFDVGQQLLNNRREYSEKFMRIIPPQKVLKMYDTEGKMRNRVMEMNRKPQQRTTHKTRP